jgi:spermidine synthase
MSCYRQPGEQWIFYELDPLVVRIARDRSLFRSLSACAPGVPVVIGDARLTLRTAPPDTDVLILDAFTSDSVPVHLLTREAFALYKSKLSPHGVIVFHISNRNLELADVVAASAAANGMASAIHHAQANDGKSRKFSPEVAVVARDQADLAALKLGGDWTPENPKPGFRTWTDDYSNMLGILLQRLAR